MNVEIRLKELLHEFHLYDRGMEQKIADSVNIHRHTVGKLLRNQSPNPSLATLAKICKYLIQNGVPKSILPGALFRLRPSGLWKAVGEPKRVAIYLGMYQQVKEPGASGATPMSVAQNDAAVSARLTTLLSDEAEMGDSRPLVRLRYQPFQWRFRGSPVQSPSFEEDKLRAHKTFQAMRQKGRAPESAILLGSQRANYLVECFVADLFGCTPFEEPGKDPLAPFFLSYRESDWPMPSCFGGTKIPWISEKPSYGIHFEKRPGVWDCFEWQENRHGAGVVIMTRFSNVVEMAVFGFSGRATNAIGGELSRNPEKFWEEFDQTRGGSTVLEDGRKKRAKLAPPKNLVLVKGREVAVYLCRVTFSPPDSGPAGSVCMDFGDDKVEVTPLSATVLKPYLSARD